MHSQGHSRFLCLPYHILILQYNSLHEAYNHLTYLTWQLNGHSLDPTPRDVPSDCRHEQNHVKYTEVLIYLDAMRIYSSRSLGGGANVTVGREKISLVWGIWLEIEALFGSGEGRWAFHVGPALSFIVTKSL